MMIYASNSTPAGPVAFALTLAAGCIQGRFKGAGKDRPSNQFTSTKDTKPLLFTVQPTILIPAAPFVGHCSIHMLC
jgi:hypothetical protein